MLNVNELSQNKIYRSGPIMITIHSIYPKLNKILLNDFSDLLIVSPHLGKAELDLDLFLETFYEIGGEIDIFNPQKYYDNFDWWIYKGMVNNNQHQGVN